MDERIFELPDECCNCHGDRCNYCFNCPELPNAPTMAEVQRLLSPCEEDARQSEGGSK
jgi:hypothetical protein